MRSIAVLDRTKEPGAAGEPLYLDVIAALARGDGPRRRRRSSGTPRVIGGRYGLSSKEFTPAHVKAVFDELAADRGPKRHFTVGIYDDVTHLSLDRRPRRSATPGPPARCRRCSSGSAPTAPSGANKASVKIIGEHTDLFAQGYFVYDSKKSGSVTVSHLRFGPEPIRSTYLIDDADFVACHQFGLLEKMKVLEHAKPGRDVPAQQPVRPATRCGTTCRSRCSARSIDKDIAVWVDRRLPGRRARPRWATASTPSCSRASSPSSGVLPADEAIDHIKASVEQTYGTRGRAIVERNFAAIDASLAALAPRRGPGRGDGHHAVASTPSPTTRRTSSRGSRRC